MPNSMQQLLTYGQSVWLDNLRRSMFASGELKRLIENGLRGMTSNPTIFEKAIGAGNDYDEQLRSLIGSERDADALFWDLAVADIRSACDEFSGVYASSKGGDGFVSLEVSPLLARDTAGTIAMAKTLWERVDRPNLMVKIPGTNEGIPAIEECIFAGIMPAPDLDAQAARLAAKFQVLAAPVLGAERAKMLGTRLLALGEAADVGTVMALAGG